MNEQLEKIAKFFNAENVVTNEEMQQAIDAIAQVLLTFKEATTQVNQDTQRQLGELMSKVEEAYQKNVGEVSMAQLEQAIADVRSKVDEVMAMRPRDGRDGVDGRDGKNGKDGRDGRDGKNGSPDTAEQIKGKLETLKGDARLDASAIKNLPEATQTVVREMTLGQVETPLKAGTGITITKDATGAKVISSSGGGTGDVVGPSSATDGAFPLFDGTTGKLIKNSAYTPASFAPALGADDNYVTDAEKVVIGNTSGTNTGDQDLSGYLTKATYDAHSVLYATTDNTPVALTVGEQTVVGRATGGNISALAIDSDISSVSANHDTLPSAKATKAYADLMLPLAGGTMSGNITLGENTSIALDPAGSAADKYTGITVTGTAGADLAFGDLVYLDPTDSRWELADANAASGADGDARGMLGIVVNDPSGDGQSVTVLLNGIVRADTAFPTFTVNNPIYVSETAGDVTQTQPTTTDVVIRIVGSALTADEMYFNPDWTWTTHT